MKKNRSLFESQRHINETNKFKETLLPKPRESIAALLSQNKQQSRVCFNPNQSSYSPYKTVCPRTRQLIQQHQQQLLSTPKHTTADYSTQSRRVTLSPSNHQVVSGKTVLPRHRQLTATTTTNKKINSLTSFNNLFKRPFKKIVQSVRSQENDKHSDKRLLSTKNQKSKQQQQQGEREEEEKGKESKDCVILKSVVGRDSCESDKSFADYNQTTNIFSSSKRLYLLPERDKSVCIDLRYIQDLIPIVERQLKREEEKRSRISAKEKLNQLFNTYSLRRNTKLRQVSDSSSLPFSSSTSQRHKQFTSFTLGYNFNQVPHYNRDFLLELILSKLVAKVTMPSGKSDKATIVDNKDGTIKITYEPKEVGQHELLVRYNDETIDDGPTVFYVDAIGSGKKKITAYGSGLARAVAGKTNQFTINTGGLGSAKLNVTVEGPSKSQVSLTDNKDDTISVGYTTPFPGEYKIKISFDGKKVVGSPFTAIARDDAKIRVFAGVDRGIEKSLNLKVSEEDLKTLCAIVTSPCGLEEPAKCKILANGQLAVTFTAREQGDHVCNVKKAGNHIAGSPFKFDILSRDVTDARQVKVSGKTKEATVGVSNEVVINTKEAGCGYLSASIEGPGHAELSANEATEGCVKLTYLPSEPGCYSLLIKYGDHIVPGSPFVINVTGKGNNLQRELIKRHRKLPAALDANTECHFNFRMPGTSAYDLCAKIRSPQGESEDVSVKDKGDYEYQVSFVPKEVGLYSLSIRLKDIHILGSPFPYTVGPLTSSGAHRVRCAGPGLVRGVCKKLNEFDVFTREAGSGDLQVIVEGPSKPKITYTDRNDGSCHVGYIVDEPGEYKVHVLFNEQEAPDSPFKAYLMSMVGDVSKVELGPLPPENMIQLNKPCNMTVIMNGAKGNIEAKVRLPDGKFEDCFASPIDAENWGVRFIPRQVGVHQVHIKFNKGSAHIPQSPVCIRVGHDNADPAEVVAHGNGIKDSHVNHVTDFTVDTCAAGRALLEASIEGPSRCPLNVVEVDEGYRFHYTPLAAGDYIISIKYNNSFICGSPFKATALKQPGSKAISDLGTVDVSRVSISTTEREAKQKVEHMPKFKSDASRVYCKGMGLKKAFANKPNTITVNCSEAGFNMISASFLGPTRNTIHEVSVKHMGGSIFQVTYNCKDRGDAILVIKYGDEQIPGSPFRLENS